MKTTVLVASIVLAVAVTTWAEDCPNPRDLEHTAEQIADIGRRIHVVHRQLTDLRVGANLLVGVLLGVGVGVFALLAYVWGRTRQAEADIQVLQRVRIGARR